MKVLLEYDPGTGALSERSGAVITTWMNLQSFESEDALPISAVIKLKEVGFDADEIVAMHKAGVL